MTPLRLVFAVVLVATALASPASAQAPSSRQPSVAPSGPALSLQAVGVRRTSEAPLPLKNPAPFRADTRQNRALMIVGGAGMLTGLVIGGDAGTLISVGGTVVFLWGLYQYLN